MTAIRTEHLAEGVTLYLGDCAGMDFADLQRSAAVVSDPPYGMNHNTDSTRFSVGQSPNIGRGRGDGRADWGAIEGDAEPFDPARWLQFRECLLWGANHYAQALPVGCLLVWIKKAPHLFGTFLSDAEIAWQSGGHGVYVHYEQFPPPSRMAESGNGKVAHPTQKPIGLMEWCIGRTKAETILDPYMGSGTTGVAAVRLGRGFVGVEKSSAYFDAACRRISDELRRPRLFTEKPPAPVQTSMFAAE